MNRQQWGDNLAEFMVVGTAIKHSAGGNYRTVDNRPFTSDLSGQDFWTLMQTGFRPLSLVMGTVRLPRSPPRHDAGHETHG